MQCLLVQLAPDSVMGKPLDLLAQSVDVEIFYSVHDARVDAAAVFVEQPTVGDVVAERVFEGILQVRKELCRVEKLSRLQIVKKTA